MRPTEAQAKRCAERERETETETEEKQPRTDSGSGCWSHFYIFARKRNLTAKLLAQQIAVTNNGEKKKYRNSLNISANMEMDIDSFNT